MTSRRHARQVGIVHVLRSREWVSAGSLAQRFEVAARTIYRDIDELIAAGVPIESVSGPEGGYRLASDQPLTPLTLDADEALRLYVLSLLDQPQPGGRNAPAPKESSTYSRKALERLGRRIYFDTSDWYWKDEGSGHLPVVRHALLTGTALSMTTRVKGRATPEAVIVKPYGVVWKAGEWHLVAAPAGEPPARYRLNLVDRLTLTDLQFSYPAKEFNLRSWWARAMEAHGKGDTRVVLRARPAARDELLRLTLKSNSEVEHTAGGGLVIRLFVDRWEWLVPLLSSYGGDAVVDEPAELRDAVVAHHRRALDAYEGAAGTYVEPVAARFRNDDSRLRSTRGRTPTET
jgi:predicted DNA-binding transcriptional regulator YafY